MRPRHELFTPVVVKPRFARLEAGDDPMARGLKVPCRVLAQRLIAAADVAALRAAAQMEPPAILCETLDAARAGGRNAWIDAFYSFAHAAFSSIAAC